MKNIALIPIDNRPVCYTLPKMIADINPEVKLVLPPRDLLSSFKTNADIDALFEWLENVQNTDYIIISADTLIYGGLIPSRRSSETKEIFEQRLLKLRNLLLSKQNSKIMLFSSIMRISNNNINEEEKDYWKDWGKKLFEYSYNFHRFEAEGDTDAKNRVKKLSNEIPPNILIDWLSTRERNFEINKMYLDLYDNGLINTLIFSKDDCAQYGFNIKEANYFELQSQRRKRAFVKTGADEIPITLLARCIAGGSEIKIAPFFTNPDKVDCISNYEDISVKKSVETQILTCGAKLSDIEEADLILYVNNFATKQGEIVMGVETEGFSGEIKTFNKPYFVADIVNANGADNKFVKKMFDKGFDNNFLGYAGWNTTGNTLGSVISAAISFYTAKVPDKTAFKRLQAVRFLDDWAYQANIRQKVKKEYLGVEQLLKEGNTVLKDKFGVYEKEVKEFLNGVDFGVEYSFPWGRFFEIEVELT